MIAISRIVLTFFKTFRGENKSGIIDGFSFRREKADLQSRSGACYTRMFGSIREFELI